MRPLLIDDEARKNIAKVLAFAEANKYPKYQMELRMRGKADTPGDIDEFTCYLVHGFKVVCTIEEQPFGWAKHISVSVDDPAKVPHQAAMKMICEEFGIKADIFDPKAGCYIWIEETSPKAINVLAPI